MNKGNYTYLHTNPPANLLFQVAQELMFDWVMPVIRMASCVESYVLQSIQSLVNCIIFLDSFNQFLLLAFLILSVTGHLPSACACLILSCWVPHLKFETWLLNGSLSLCKTIGRLSGLGMYVIATSLLTLQNLFVLSFKSVVHKYQLTMATFLNLPACRQLRNFGWLQMSPYSVIAYLHSYQGISFIEQWLNIISRYFILFQSNSKFIYE